MAQNQDDQPMQIEAAGAHDNALTYGANQPNPAQSQQAAGGAPPPAAPGGAPAPAPNVQQSFTQYNVQVDAAQGATNLQELARMIAAGVDRAAILERMLHDFGVSLEKNDTAQRERADAVLHGMQEGQRVQSETTQRMCDALVHATRTSTEHIKETTDALRGLAVQQAQAPQGAGAGAAAHPGAAQNRDAQLGEALNNIAAMLAESQATRAQKVSCSHENLETLLRELEGAHKRASGIYIDKFFAAIGVAGLVFDAAFPGRAHRDVPALPELACAKKQWCDTRLLTLQKELTDLKDWPCESDLERDRLKHACEVFFRKTKHCEGWFRKPAKQQSPKGEPHRAPKGGSGGNPQPQQQGQKQQQHGQKGQLAIPPPPPKQPRGKNTAAQADGWTG